MRHPLVVCHIITTVGGGGAERQLAELVAASDRGFALHHVIGLSDRYDPLDKLKATAAGLTCLGLHIGPDALIRGLPRLIAVLRRIKPDIVQTWMYHADLLGTMAVGLTGRSRLIWYLQASDMDLSLYGRRTALVRGACRRLSRWPAAVAANSEAGLRAHRALGYANKNLLVIPNGFDTEHFRFDPEARRDMRSRLGLSDDQPLVGMVARLDPVKDHAGFLAAAALVARHNPQARFVMLGQGVTEDNAALAAALPPGLAGRCHLLGHSEEVHRWLSAMDLHVSSSLSEGLPNAVGEAMACQLPNVVTAVGDSPLLVGDTGRVVPVKDPETMARAILDILDLPVEQRLELGLSARARIQSRYSISALVNNFAQLYAKVLA